jgi:hypothetical protein
MTIFCLKSGRFWLFLIDYLASDCLEACVTNYRAVLRHAYARRCCCFFLLRRGHELSTHIMGAC